ncbi:Aste57867_18882 [Aphanomyces stellatus]|uniref:tetrahydrofolate synthase n=1 Tax=Aphanomyces stellatus TaxID=120398 RepID=A0A485LFH6_9STRA|nr:hypothetical protein As57867_018818 [Aphanomyces stellatus]VFT95616.1 Aste57867_18882 [Aphanomyces stellatus]
MRRVDEFSIGDIAALRSRGMDGAMELLLSMPNSPGNIVPAAGLFTRESANAMMRHYMKRTNVDASSLSVVHIAGTKGKGSTCAFTESILRAHDVKTGMFTSPHLIHPNERFRINGKPVSDTLFVGTFWSIVDGLLASEDDLGGYPRHPNYFTVLTLMALRLFVAERVDVAILEVGLGGRLDATNVIDTPVVCGITALDYDHTRILGDTLDKIAKEKAGIIKPGVPAFTIVQAEAAAQETLAACASEEPTTLVIAPPLSSYNFTTDQLATCLGMQGQYQLINASLAVALASTWLAATRGLPLVQETMTPTMLEGLRSASWPGRAQSVVDTSSTAVFYLDGAHTPLSMECCVAWFATQNSSNPKFLVFNCHHERDVVALFEPLLAIEFDHVVFCPTGGARPSICRIPSVQDALAKASVDTTNLDPHAMQVPADIDEAVHWQHVCAAIWRILKARRSERTTVSILPSMTATLDWIRESATASPRQTQVLVTGSLYTVGEALLALGWKD